MRCNPRVLAQLLGRGSPVPLGDGLINIIVPSGKCFFDTLKSSKSLNKNKHLKRYSHGQCICWLQYRHVVELLSFNSVYNTVNGFSDVKFIVTVFALVKAQFWLWYSLASKWCNEKVKQPFFPYFHKKVIFFPSNQFPKFRLPDFYDHLPYFLRCSLVRHLHTHTFAHAPVSPINRV